MQTTWADIRRLPHRLSTVYISIIKTMIVRSFFQQYSKHINGNYLQYWWCSQVKLNTSLLLICDHIKHILETTKKYSLANLFNIFIWLITLKQVVCFSSCFHSARDAPSKKKTQKQSISSRQYSVNNTIVLIINKFPLT